jgi:hypothetical protein
MPKPGDGSPLCARSGMWRSIRALHRARPVIRNDAFDLAVTGMQYGRLANA